MSVKSLILSSLVVVLFCAFSVAPADAQDYGARLGLSVNPDQFYFGGHVESEPVFEELIFRPNVEIGVGDGGTVVALNGEFAWPFELDQGGEVFAGLGPAINIASSSGDTEVLAGFNFLVGYEHDEGYFAEIKVGVIDSPEFKLGFGYTWHD